MFTGRNITAGLPDSLTKMVNFLNEKAEKVHLLFMANYIDYSGYDFRDDGQVESYCWCYRDLFELKTKESQEIGTVNLSSSWTSGGRMLPLAIGRQRMISAIGLLTSGTTSSRPCRRR